MTPSATKLTTTTTSIKVTIKCSGKVACAGIAQVVVVTGHKVKGKTVYVTVVLASGGYRLAPGKSGVATLGLTRQGRSVFAAGRKRTVSIRLDDTHLDIYSSRAATLTPPHIAAKK
jgi:hypothetical protein